MHYDAAAAQAVHLAGASGQAAQHDLMIKMKLSSPHLEEAVKQGRLAVLNQDVPNFNLLIKSMVSPLCSSGTL